jgi:outer membrane lipoprotein SlyB
MEAVTHQSGTTQISPLVAAVAASVTIASVIGLGAVTGVLPIARSSAQREARSAGADLKAVAPSACGLCGTVESVRTFDVSDEAGATGAANERQVYRVTVRMDDGSFRAISLSTPPAFAVGEKVRVVEGKLVRG